jgi:transposase
MAERVEVVTGVRRRRNWTDEEKVRFVAQTYEPGMTVSEVARRNDLSAGLLFTWRRMAEGRAPRSVGEPVALLPVHIAEPPPAPRGRPPRAARMEIGLPGGIRLKVDAGVDPEALAAVVAVLQRR